MMIVVFQLFSLSVSAESKTMEQLGSIAVCIENDQDGKRLDGKLHFALLKVGEWNNGEYEFYSDFINASEEVKKNTNAATISDFMDHFKSMSNPDIVTTYEYGKDIVFENLKDGLYVIYAETTDNKYLFEPSFITLPYFDEENHEMINQIKVFPKYSAKCS